MPKFELETNSVLKVLLLVLAGWLIYSIYDILLLLFIAYIIMAAVNPLVAQLEEKNWPRWAAILSVFGVSIIVLGVFFGLIFAPFLNQTQRLITLFPSFLEDSLANIDLGDLWGLDSTSLDLQSIVQNLSSQLTSVPGDIIRFGANVFGGALNLITVVIFSFYLAQERGRVHDGIVEIIPYEPKKKIRELLHQVDTRLGSWLRGQFILMFIIGVVTYIGLIIVDIPFALPLAVIAGLLEIVPIIGPIISSIPAILIGLAISPFHALTVLLLYTLIQQLESSIIVPKVMHESVGLDPIIIILALMIGGRLAGPIGALLAVPLAVVVMIIYREWPLD